MDPLDDGEQLRSRSVFGAVSEEEEHFWFGQFGEDHRNRQSQLVSFQSAGVLQQTSQRLHQEDEESDQTGPEHQLQTAVAATRRRRQVPVLTDFSLGE
ncbi:uncharacterized protein LOC108229145 isoform X1 [Kryptolebias marmoratus]|uniref:uncharacterized protein LOC108229145 isoform X1 n=1 Tax=Kryptolebias marmoratus TaxID=37003 RepID=UPI0018AC9131|nr:uncharacterized protein LOC108229145 isoform X1 [Kryptolebias marmoratus]